MNLQSSQTIYDSQHEISVVCNALPGSLRRVLVKIIKMSNRLVIKLQEINDYNFNYTAEIDELTFNQMKSEQSLEIQFDEIYTQIVDMLRDTFQQNKFLRLEMNENVYKLIFFEKSRLKSLISLIIDLQPTDQSEIIAEISKNLHNYKDANKQLNQQVTSMKKQLTEANNSHKALKNQYNDELHLITEKFTENFHKTEKLFHQKLTTMERRHLKIQNDVQVLKNHEKLKLEENARLVSTVHSLRIDNERNNKLLDDYKLEVDHLKRLKSNSDEEITLLRNNYQREKTKNEEASKQLIELKRDVQEATLIIAQKTKQHDEIGKDLMQANSMLVNFNNQYDNLSKEFDALKNQLGKKQHQVDELLSRQQQIQEDYEGYKASYGPDKVQMLQNELFLARKTHQETDKQYKEAIKLNALLTRKLSSNDGISTVSSRTTTNLLPPPSQRSNY